MLVPSNSQLVFDDPDWVRVTKHTPRNFAVVFSGLFFVTVNVLLHLYFLSDSTSVGEYVTGSIITLLISSLASFNLFESARERVAKMAHRKYSVDLKNDSNFKTGKKVLDRAANTLGHHHEITVEVKSLLNSMVTTSRAIDDFYNQVHEYLVGENVKLGVDKFTCFNMEPTKFFVQTVEGFMCSPSQKAQIEMFTNLHKEMYVVHDKQLEVLGSLDERITAFVAAIERGVNSETINSLSYMLDDVDELQKQLDCNQELKRYIDQLR